MDGGPVVFLIQEKAGFLAVLYINQIFHAVLLDLYAGIEGLRKKAFEAFHAFLEADLGVAALIDAAHLDAVFGKNPAQNIQDQRLEAINAERQGFHHQHVGKLVHHQAGKPVRLSEDDPAASRIHGPLPVFPGVPYPLFPECIVDYRILPAGEQTHSDFGAPVDEACSQKEAVEVQHMDQAAVLHIFVHGRNFIVINPHAARFQRAACALFQSDGSGYGIECILHAYLQLKAFFPFSFSDSACKCIIFSL